MRASYYVSPTGGWGLSPWLFARTGDCRPWTAGFFFTPPLAWHRVRGALPPVGLLVHGQVDDLCWRLQRFGKNRVGGVDERLDQFHSHACPSSATPTGAA